MQKAKEALRWLCQLNFSLLLSHGCVLKMDEQRCGWRTEQLQLPSGHHYFQIHHSGQSLLQLLWLQRESKDLAIFASISDAIVSSHGFSCCLGSSSKKSDLTMGKAGGGLLMRAEEEQTQTILWNALRVDVSNSHFSY